MNNNQIIKLVEREFEENTLEVTKQYLEIHSPIYRDNKIKIDRIDRESEDENIIVYVPVLKERFYFAVYLNTETEQVTGFGTEAYHKVYFRATSDNLSSNELKAMTSLEATKFWDKGDFKGVGKSKYAFSNFEILPNPEPDEFEDKLKKLLCVLEKDKNGIRSLVERADGYIQVSMDIHNANGMIGGIHIDAIEMQRMSEFGLSINFDLLVSGNSFSD